MTPKKAPLPRTLPKQGVKETDIVKSILDALAWKYKGRAHFHRNNTGALKTENRFMRFGERGSADIFGVLQGGRFVALEVKTQTGKVSPAQELWLSEMKSLGALVGVVTSMDEAIELIEGGLI